MFKENVKHLLNEYVYTFFYGSWYTFATFLGWRMKNTYLDSKSVSARIVSAWWKKELVCLQKVYRLVHICCIIWKKGV